MIQLKECMSSTALQDGDGIWGGEVVEGRWETPPSEEDKATKEFAVCLEEGEQREVGALTFRPRSLGCVWKEGGRKLHKELGRLVCDAVTPMGSWACCRDCVCVTVPLGYMAPASYRPRRNTCIQSCSGFLGLASDSSSLS